jgi:Uma2 family endonuclease
MSTTPPVQTRRWKRVEYERMIECGLFAPGERVELIDGLLVVREPQSARHVTAVSLVEEALRRAFAPGWHVRAHAPVALDEDSEPEPDVSVVPGHPRDYAEAHPTRPVLVVEVAVTSLAFDREHKASLYARAGVPDYWLVNTIDAVLEVRRRPLPADATPYGWLYEEVGVLGADATVRPLAVPQAAIRVGDLLP